MAHDITFAARPLTTIFSSGKWYCKRIPWSRVHRNQRSFLYRLCTKWLSIGVSDFRSQRRSTVSASKTRYEPIIIKRQHYQTENFRMANNLQKVCRWARQPNRGTEHASVINHSVRIWLRRSVCKDSHLVHMQAGHHLAS